MALLTLALTLTLAVALLRRHEEGEKRRDRAELAALDLVGVRARVSRAKP